jgi:nitrite reductase (NO-forming)
MAAAALTLSLAACADDGPETTAAADGSSGAVSASGTLAVGATIEFRASEFAFAPMELTAEPGSYRGVLINDGSIVHDITFAGGEPIVASPGESVEFELLVPETGLEFHCSIAGHSDAGMTGVIHTPGSAVAAGGGHDSTATEAAVVEADPDAPPYERRDPTVPARGEGEGVTLVAGGADDGGDLIEVEMVVEEKLMTVAEGYRQLVWTFNGTVPGPVLRTQVGDTVRVHLVNPAEASASHSVDFHASQVAWNDEMRSIAPGEDLVYEFTTDYAGVWMYHCGTDPVLHHIANGMFGIVIVEPEGGLSPVEHEFFLVQNEWYLGPQGEVSSFAKANQAAPAPDFVMFNGVAFQYLDHPIEVPTGDRVRLFVLDVGPSIDSSFHIVGTIFDDVIKEGVHLVSGNEGNWGSQAVDLSPAQGAIIELTTAEDGLYPIVTHAFNLPGRGALGLLQAGDGEP